MPKLWHKIRIGKYPTVFLITHEFIERIGQVLAEYQFALEMGIGLKQVQARVEALFAESNEHVRNPEDLRAAFDTVFVFPQANQAQSESAVVPPVLGLDVVTAELNIVDSEIDKMQRKLANLYAQRSTLKSVYRRMGGE